MWGYHPPISSDLHIFVRASSCAGTLLLEASMWISPVVFFRGPWGRFTDLGPQAVRLELAFNLPYCSARHAANRCQVREMRLGIPSKNVAKMYMFLCHYIESYILTMIIYYLYIAQ